MDKNIDDTLPNHKKISYRSLANAIRALCIDSIEKAGSGHPGIALGMADVMTVLFSEFLRFAPDAPLWPNRDRFVLSAGHGSMLLYSLLYLLGYNDLDIQDIKNFRQLNSKTAGHPEYGMISGIETTTGPLGQGFANAVGMAIAERMISLKFPEIINHKTFVVVGDGCLMEGISYEAAAIAGHFSLSNLVVLFDNNGITIDGSTSLVTSENQSERFKAAGWYTQEIDGHDFEQISFALSNAVKSDKPSLISCKTVIGYGSPNKSGSETSHGAPLGKEEAVATKKNLGWDADEFLVPEDILSSWRMIGESHREEYSRWCELYNQVDNKKRLEFERRYSQQLPENFTEVINKLKSDVVKSNICEATRKSSGRFLAEIAKIMPELVGGSADLTSSNETKPTHLKPISKNDFDGQYIYYGIREHAMSAIMNGIALYKAFIPYSGTFLVFSDYCKPAIRLSALMKQRVIYVMTHDSIGLGEDGPTHQPVEHLSSLRAIPGLLVFRPADVVETIESWQLALSILDRPSVLALTRQNVQLVRNEVSEVNMVARGAYIIREAKHRLQVTIFATGSEVNIAKEVHDELDLKGIGVRVVSMACWELFEQQSKSYQDMLIKNDSIKVAIEAAGRMGWDKYIGNEGIFIGMESFGASGRADDLYRFFGITKEATIRSILSALEE